MTKKSATTVQAGETAAGSDLTQEKLNELYTAHQVHTLAQLIYQQVAARRSGGNPWAPMNGQPSRGGGMGHACGAHQPLTYWYP